MISVIGAGKVGSSTSMLLALKALDDIMLVDIAPGLARGEALDLSQTNDFSVGVSGSESIADIRGSGLVINIAGASRKPGMTRQDLAAINARTTEAVAEGIRKHASDAIVIQVANPLDLMALLMHRKSGLPCERVIGMGNLTDSMRFRHFIAREAGADVSVVEGLVMGEHGDSMVPIVSGAKIKRKPIASILEPGRISDIVERTRKGGAEVIGLKGSTTFAPAFAIARMAEAVVRGPTQELPASVLLRGEYGVSGVYAGVTARLGKEGVIKVMEIGISADELESFRRSCEAIVSGARALGFE